MDPLEVLLEVQARDIAVDRLVHRRANLPERKDLAAVEARLATLAGRRAEIEEVRGELLRRQGDLEAEVESVTGRIRSIESRLYGGEVSASRELSAMAEEVESLRRRRSQLEDRVVEVMEEMEPIDAELGALLRACDEAEGEAEALRSAISGAEAVIDAEVASEQAERAPLAAQLPDALARQYESLRHRLGGVGAARLVNGSCSGCHLALPAMELERILNAAPGAVVTCDQCGRILVR